MKISLLEQGTPEWLDWRHDGIGASENGVLMGVNKYEDVHTLWSHKVNREQKEANEATRHGSRTEDLVRQIVSRNFGLKFEPVCAEDDKFPYIRASLDGISACGKYVLEIKCPFRFHNFLNAKKKIPEYYYTQMQQQLAVSGAETALFINFFEGDYSYQLVEKDQSVIDTIYSRCSKFWNEVVSKELPSVQNYTDYRI